MLRLSGGLFFRVEFCAPYAVIALPQHDLRAGFADGADHVLPFHLVTSGAIWFDVPGETPVRLEQDEIIVLPQGSSHTLTDRVGQTPIRVGELMDRVSGRPPTLRYGGDGAASVALCGFFRCNGKLFNPLLAALPTVLVIRRDAERTPWLTANLRRVFTEGAEARPGGLALVERLTELLFVDVVQAHLRHEDVKGWLAGLSDPMVGRALALLHEHPARAWTVEILARKTGASRSGLADRFAATVGLSPMRYLAAWRMELAADRLASTEGSVAEIAAGIGYESEASFNRAFKRHVGQPPATWRRTRQPG